MNGKEKKRVRERPILPKPLFFLLEKSLRTSRGEGSPKRGGQGAMEEARG